MILTLAFVTLAGILVFVLRPSVAEIITGQSGIETAPKHLQPVLRWRGLAESESQGVPIEFILAVIKTESDGDPDAVNSSDPSAGLMQVTPLIGKVYANLSGTKEEILKRLLDPRTNIRAGAGFLEHLRRQYAHRFDFREWAIAYNAGETNFNKGFRNDYGTKAQKNLEEVLPWLT